MDLPDMNWATMETTIGMVVAIQQVARGWHKGTTASCRVARELLTEPRGRGIMSMRDSWTAAMKKDQASAVPRSTMR